MADKNRDKLPDTEEGLISQAQLAVSHCNWIVGDCAAKWTKKYAKGRTDADFAAMVGLSADQVYQRRRVSETFADVHDDYSALKWSHFYAALTWDDSPECLQWAQENEETVAGMKAWRRAMRGEDLTEEMPVDDFGGDPAVAYLPGELDVVRDPSEWESSSGEPRERGDNEAAETVNGFARDSAGDGSDYSPFRSGAGSPAPKPGAEGGTATAVPKPEISPEQAIKRMTTAIERVNKLLTPEFLAAFGSFPAKQRDRFTRAVAELSSKAAGLL